MKSRLNSKVLSWYTYTEFFLFFLDLSELCTKYQNNLNEDVTSFEFTKEEIPGMPSHWFCDEKLIKRVCSFFDDRLVH